MPGPFCARNRFVPSSHSCPMAAADQDTAPTREPESRGLSPLGAVAALVGFYVGALAFAAVLVGLAALVAYLAATIRLNWLIVAAAAAFVAALVVVWSILPRYDRFDPPGPELHESDAPMLFAELRELAAAAGQAMPKHVYVVSRLNAFVTERGGIMGIGSRRVLGIGLPLLEILTVDELRSVLAHELGHFHGGDTKIGPWLYKVRAGFERSIDNLDRAASFIGEDFGPFAAVLGMARAPFVWFGRVFMRHTRALGRAQECRADALSVRLVGSAPAVSALEKVHEYDGAFEHYFHSEVAPVLAGGRRPPILAGFRGYLATSSAAAWIEESRANEKTEHDVYDTHPPLCERVARARELAVPNENADDRPAHALLRDVDWVERRLVHFGRGAKAEVEKIEWAEVTPIHVAQWRDEVSHAQRYLAGMAMAMIPRGEALRPYALARFGRSAENASDEALATMALDRWSAAIGVALLDLGWSASTSVGEAVVLRWGDIECRPRPEVARWLSGETTDEAWQARARQIGLEGVDLGAPVVRRETAA